MKKTILLTLAASAVGASQLMGADLYITGSTAFRANVHDACLALFDSTPTEQTGTPATGGDTKTGNAAAQWCLSGPVGSKVTSLGFTTLNIHAIFTGSVQGIQSAETPGSKLTFVNIGGTTNNVSATIAFSDVATASTPYPATGNYTEEKVAVQPFVFVRSAAGGGLLNVTNLTAEQLKDIIQIGRLPLSAWTTKAADTTSFVYLVNRTKDSGTRRTAFAEVVDIFNQSALIYLYDSVTNNAFYKPNGTVIVSSAGNGQGNGNLNWGSGYVGGGDIKTEMAINNAANQAISYLSISDAKGIIATTNYSQLISYNGVWPTTLGSAITANYNSTNDFSPVSLGKYPFWSYEVVVFPTVDPSSLSGDQNLTAAQLGSQGQAGTILGVLNAQTVINGGNPIPGSIEATIQASEPAGAIALRLSEMHASRAAVGGTITP
jgi:hypothetical protein